MSALAEKGIPCDPDMEQLVLGAILLGQEASLEVEDFMIEKNRRIYTAIQAIFRRGDKVDHAVVAAELHAAGKLESVGGLSYLVSLDDSLPRLYNFDQYARALRDLSRRRQAIARAQHLIDRMILGQFLGDDEDPISQRIDRTIQEGATSICSTMAPPVGGLRTVDAIVGDRASEFMRPPASERGVETGFYRLDAMTNGFRPGELVIVAARPAMGKTAFALNVASQAAAAGKRIGLFSLEMTQDDLVKRLLVSAAHVDSLRYRRGELSDNEMQAVRMGLHRICEQNLYIDDNPNLTVSDIRAKCSKVELDMVIVDYLQLMTCRAENRTQEVSKLSRGLKLLAKELAMPFVVLSQLSRATEQRGGDRMPHLSDLRESGSIEQDADVVIFLHRPWYYKQDREDLRGVAEVKVAKQRNGPTGTIRLAFLDQWSTFANFADDSV